MHAGTVLLRATPGCPASARACCRPRCPPCRPCATQGRLAEATHPTHLCEQLPAVLALQRGRQADEDVDVARLRLAAPALPLGAVCGKEGASRGVGGGQGSKRAAVVAGNAIAAVQGTGRAIWHFHAMPWYIPRHAPLRCTRAAQGTLAGRSRRQSRTCAPRHPPPAALQNWVR